MATATIARHGALASSPRMAITRPRLISGIWPSSLAVWMAGIYIALFVVRPWEKLFPQLAEMRFERVYAVAMVAVVLVEGLRLRASWQSAGVMAFLGTIGLAGVAAVDPALAWDPFYKYLTLVVFYFVLLSVSRTAYTLLFLVTCYLLAMGIYVSKGLWEFYVHGHHHYTMGVVRLIGIDVTFGGPNDLATSLLLSLPMVLLLLHCRAEFTATWPRFWQRLLPVCLAVYVALAVWSIMLTKSRAGMLAFLVYAGLLVLRPPGLFRKLMIAVVALGSLWLMMPEESRDRLRTVWSPESGPTSAQKSAQGRVEGLKAGLEMFSRSPLVGVGPGNFVAYRKAQLDGVPLEAHNLLGQVLGETGILGGAAFVFMVGYALWRGYQLRRALRVPRTGDAHVARAVALACRDVIVLLLFDGIFGHNVLRFNYLWAAAFTQLSWELSRTAVHRSPARDTAPAASYAWRAVPRRWAAR